MHTFFVCSKAATCWNLVRLGNLIRELLGMVNNFNVMLFLPQVIIHSTTISRYAPLEPLEES